MKRAIICDLDGTLALFEGKRGPYETDRCADDIVNHPIAFLLDLYRSGGRYLGDSLELSSPTIILCSGRFADFRDLTENWLSDHTIPYDYLFMRPSGDKRMDAEVKQEILIETILGELGFELEDIDFVLDDRNQVVDMWRAWGLTCLQVAPGDF